MGHLLHPHYRGNLLKKRGDFDLVKTKLVDSHPSTLEFLEKQQDLERNKDTQAPIAANEIDELDIFTMDDFNPNQSDDQNISQCLSDIERELNIFFQMPIIKEGLAVDVLAW